MSHVFCGCWNFCNISEAVCGLGTIWENTAFCSCQSVLSFLNPFQGTSPPDLSWSRGAFILIILELFSFQHPTGTPSSLLLCRDHYFTFHYLLLPFSNSGNVLFSSYCYHVVRHPLLRKSFEPFHSYKFTKRNANTSIHK